MVELREEAGCEVGIVLRALIERHGLNVEGTADLAGVDSGNLYRIMAGRLPLWASYAWKLAGVLGAEVLALVDGEALLRRVDVDAALRRRTVGKKGMEEYLLPGGVRVMVPPGLMVAKV